MRNPQTVGFFIYYTLYSSESITKTNHQL